MEDNRCCWRAILAGQRRNWRSMRQNRDRGSRWPNHRYTSDDYPHLEDIALDFLSRHDHAVTHACFGVAGPVVNGHVKTTNLPWEMDEQTLCAALQTRQVFLLNDLESVANAVPRLGAAGFVHAQRGAGDGTAGPSALSRPAPGWARAT